MKRTTMCTMILSVVLLATASLATAGVPLEWNYQGHLTDNGGQPLDTTVSMTFVIYDDSVGGVAPWTETHPAVSVMGGGFSVRLGSIVPLPDGILEFPTVNPQAWLGVTVGTDAEMTPRTALTSVPYAYRVSTVDGATGGTVAGPDPDKYIELRADSSGGSLEFYDDEGRTMQLSTDPAMPALSAGMVIGDTWHTYNLRIDSSEVGVHFEWMREADTSGVNIVVDSNMASVNIAFRDTTLLMLKADTSGGTFWVWPDDEFKANGTPMIELSSQRGFVLTPDAADGYVLTCDEFGVGTWQPGGSGSSCWECPGNYTYLTDEWDSVGIGTETPSEKLEVVGNTIITGKATIGPGHTNSGDMGFAAGQGHIVTGNYAVAGGGLNHAASGPFSHVGGGSSNHADGYASNVSGGYYNAAMGNYSTVGGGQFDTASGDHAAIGGGGYNTATGDEAVVAGGWDNDATGWRSAVGGGVWNTASATWSTVGGGASNKAYNNDATVSGGASNTASGWGSTVSGGDENEASGTQSVVGGGEFDTTKALYGGVFSGYSNLAGDEIDDTAATVCGGYNNDATGRYAVVSGGKDNSATDYWATVGGGYQSRAFGHGSVVCGGVANLANANTSAVVGGNANTADGLRSIVGAGQGNYATGDYAAVVSGTSNRATGNWSSVVNGSDNLCEGSFSVIPGGERDTLTTVADYSMAFGEEVYLNSSYTVCLFDSLNDGYLGINRDDHNGGINYPIHVGTDASNGNGAYLTNGGVWTIGTGKASRGQIEKLDGKEVLGKIDQLPTEAWQIDETGERHVFPSAEQFHSLFNLGDDSDTPGVAPADLAGVALIGVKELHRMTTELQQKAEQVDRLEERLANLESMVESLLAQTHGGSDKLASSK